MKKIKKEVGDCLTWFFCGCAFMYLLVIVGVMFNFVKFNV